MADHLYRMYLNIQLFATEYRGYAIQDAFMDKASFIDTMQAQSYIKHKLSKDGRAIMLVFFKENSKYIKNRKNMEGFMNAHIPKTKLELILVIKGKLQSRVKNYLDSLRGSTDIYIYQHRLFIIELNRGPLCSRHILLTPDEVHKLELQDIWHSRTSLPSIPMDDPQAIWIGAKHGDVIRIEAYSEFAGYRISYRYVEQNEHELLEFEPNDAVPNLADVFDEPEPLEHEDDDDDELSEKKEQDDTEAEDIDDDLSGSDTDVVVSDASKLSDVSHESDYSDSDEEL